MAVITSPGTSGGSSVTVADGANVVEGATTDAAVTTNANGTISGKLRGIVSLLGGVLQVGGNVANGAADSGNPVKTGAVVQTVLPSGKVAANRTDLTAGPEGGLWVQLGRGAVSDGSATAATGVSDFSGNTRLLGSGVYLYNGASFDRQRIPGIVKTVQATASGDTALWTPNSGKKFRIMRLLFDLTANVSRAAGAVTTFTLRDSTTDLGITFDVFIPTTAVTTGFAGYTSGWVDLGNGILSAAANNVLNVNLGAALATGVCRVTCCGVEE